jgi:hypothetical protein
MSDMSATHASYIGDAAHHQQHQEERVNQGEVVGVIQFSYTNDRPAGFEAVFYDSVA